MNGERAWRKLGVLGTPLTRQAFPAQVNTLGRYEILGELGRGAVSIVYDARDLLTDGPVALKLIEPSLWAPPTSAAERLRFLTEAMPEWRIRHPNIVTVYDAGDGDGRLYIAMERLEGRSLRRMLDESPLPGVPRSLRMAAEVASGLAHAHERGVVHRYVKPSNILILADDRAKLTDFGMAPLRDAALASRNHAACLSYMSPEQIRCDSAIDGRSDIFSLGVVLYEMLTGERPFGGTSPAEIIRSVLDAEPPLPSEVNPDVPPAVDLLVWSMLVKNPDDRVSNAEIVVRRLRDLGEEIDGALAAHARDDGVPAEVAGTAGGPASADRHAARVPAHRGAPQGANLRLTSYVLVALIFVAAGSGLLWQWRQSSDPSETRNAAIRDEPATAIRDEPAIAIASEPSVPEEPRAAAAEPEPKKRAAKVRARRPSGSAVAGVRAPARKIQPSVAAVATAPALPAAKTATLVFDVSPWGEIYVDGKPHGTTPPVKTLGLLPGRHRIEVRNSAQPPYNGFATLQPGDVRRIRHDFE
ncbi:MAG TPA: protein kinase [Candidatus Krumholzibacteria bacterium]|nr:protein kinase [Candidatus Krumholzibacteria bacterium]